MPILYTVTNIITGKKYVGMSIRSLSVRKYEHLKELRKGIKKGLWQKEYDTYGESVFKFEVYKNTSITTISTEEIALIEELCSLEPLGYNKKLGSQSIPSTTTKQNKCPYDTDQLLLALELSLQIYPILSIQEISEASKIPKDSVVDLIRLKSFRWLSDLVPEVYSKLEEANRHSGGRSGYLKEDKYVQLLINILEYTDDTDAQISAKSDVTIDALRDIKRGKANTWLSNAAPELYNAVRTNRINKSALLMKEKMMLDTHTGILYTFKNISQIARELNIDHRRISDLLGGRLSNIYNGRFILPTKI